MYQRILVPLDGSKQAESALPLASKIARINNAEITLLRVVEYPFEMYSGCDSNTLAHARQTDEKLRTEKDTFCKIAENYLKHLAPSVEVTMSKVSIEVQEYPVVNAILSTIEKLKIDLIVMSTVGEDHNPWMMGAIANRVLREAQVPVILIRKGSYGPATDRRPSESTAVQNEAWVHSGTLS
jgi:nucleotide-binding universal stress UspA family protein